ncbi:jg6575 [Pararge aegeria aegeria]|uniref:Jg6575 protein n=1 Tax=Pararge aegeria aegeria TaxID=348720 RepID=A0A8S4R7F7_9NEOP|nr:jg6575 [Pararge aegeria aegeria]
MPYERILNLQISPAGYRIRDVPLKITALCQGGLQYLINDGPRISGKPSHINKAKKGHAKSTSCDMPPYVHQFEPSVVSLSIYCIPKDVSTLSGSASVPRAGLSPAGRTSATALEF